jgi:hypothetical protein
VSEYATLLEVPKRPIAEWTRIPNDGELFRDGTNLYMGDGSTAAASLTAFGGGGGGGGVTDHGALTGLGDDDHTQYHNNARGDARYSLTSHTHAYADITGKPSTFAPSSHTHTASEVTDFNSAGDARWAALSTKTDMAYTGGSVGSTGTALIDVHSSAKLSLSSVGLWEVRIKVTYNANVTTTGAFFSLNTDGTLAADWIACLVNYTTGSGDRDGGLIASFNGGVAVASSVVTTGNGAFITGEINVTTPGDVVLRFASEIATANSITVTNVTGWSRKKN